MIFEELKNHLESSQEESPDLNRPKAYSHSLEDPVGDTRHSRRAKKSASAAAKKRQQKRGTCRGTAAIF